jgi:hypothetical protein
VFVRYKSILSMLMIKQLMVYWLYFQKGFALYSISVYYMMLYRSFLHIGVAKLMIRFKRVFCCITQFYACGSFEKYICIKLAPNNVGISNRRLKQQAFHIQVYGLQLVRFR